jgi:SAM-dependent methyltransferase
MDQSETTRASELPTARAGEHADEQAGYRKVQGRWLRGTVAHRDAEYDSRGFGVLDEMQREHFWYRGRRRFIQAALDRHLPRAARSGVRCIDLGGGAGGWLRFIREQELFPGSELALGDSSLDALTFAQRAQGEQVGFYQTDLLDLGWHERWDVVFLLDVLEHLPDDRGGLEQVWRALRPGGTCIVTVPALRQFWSWNDEVVGHQRRYSTAQLQSLASTAGFEVLDSRYFMFFLSPLLALSRLLNAPKLEHLSDAEKWALVEKSHKVPQPLLNFALGGVFGLETPLGHHVAFPWGTSALAVLRKSA